MIHLFKCSIQLIEILILLHLLEFVYCFCNLVLVLFRDLVSEFIQLLSRGEDQAVRLVQLFNTLTDLLVLVRMLFGGLLHLLHLFITQSGALLNTDALLFSGALILRTYIEHTVGINIKCHLNLRYAPWCRWDSVKVETSQSPVVLSPGALTLQHMNFYTSLVVSCCREDLGLAGRNRRVGRSEERRVGKELRCSRGTR